MSKKDGQFSPFRKSAVVLVERRTSILLPSSPSTRSLLCPNPSPTLVFTDSAIFGVLVASFSDTFAGWRLGGSRWQDSSCCGWGCTLLNEYQSVRTPATLFHQPGNTSRGLWSALTLSSLLEQIPRLTIIMNHAIQSMPSK